MLVCSGWIRGEPGRRENPHKGRGFRGPRALDGQKISPMTGFGKIEILDTFREFLQYRDQAHLLNINGQIEAWASRYMTAWPELLEKQVADYAGQGISWREIAAERVFPDMGDRLPLMTSAHDNPIGVLPHVYRQFASRLDFASDAIFVLYVGIGCGAGWATEFRDTPAILFGLENIAELGWTSEDGLGGLAAHELGHLAHEMWRRQEKLEDATGPWGRLYEEGFAQSCEVLVRDTWHEIQGPDSRGWLEDCRKNRSKLAKEFLSRVDGQRDVRGFFGSWFEVEGISQTGYYLGHEVVRSLIDRATLKQVALIADVESVCRPMVEQIANSAI